MDDNDRWLTTRQAAALLQVSLSSVRNYLRSGRLRGRKVRGSRLVRVARDDVEALLEPLPPREPAQTRQVGAGGQDAPPT